MQHLLNKYPLLSLNPVPATMWALSCALLSALLLSISTSAQGQTSQRWFQIEVSIFSNESLADRDEEHWQTESNELNYPNPLRRLGQLSDLLITEQMIADAIAESSEQDSLSTKEEATIEIDAEALAAIERLAQILPTGPQPASTEGEFKFPDFLRDPHLQLTPDNSDFEQTNRALERSAEHRLLFHGLWRESVADPADAIPLYVQGGLRFDDQYELQGAITLRFNENRDRLVIDSNLWLTEYSASADFESEWQLPAIPEAMKTDLDSLTRDEQGLQYGINRVFHMEQSREMRSNQFHYIDHPAIGIVILVKPIDVPPLVVPEFEFDFEEAN
ncbi:MAG: CsiV family protein [Gammaproteobacteria bacterium]|nr:CsiV family protein [Gammaproteobacteria bacterium]